MEAMRENDAVADAAVRDTSELREFEIDCVGLGLNENSTVELGLLPVSSAECERFLLSIDNVELFWKEPMDKLGEVVSECDSVSDFISWESENENDVVSD